VWLVIVLRLVHVVSGALWIGMMAFSTYFLVPALGEVGPEGGKVMAALQRRRLMTFMPLTALASLISGFWLYARFTAGSLGMMGTPFGLGGVASLIAFLIGIVLVRPAMMRAAALAQDPAGNKEEARRLRQRAESMSRLVAPLLFFALGAMAVARYL